MMGFNRWLGEAERKRIGSTGTATRTVRLAAA